MGSYCSISQSTLCSLDTRHFTPYVTIRMYQLALTSFNLFIITDIHRLGFDETNEQLFSFSIQYNFIVILVPCEGHGSKPLCGDPIISPYMNNDTWNPFMLVPAYVCMSRLYTLNMYSIRSHILPITQYLLSLMFTTLARLPLVSLFNNAYVTTKPVSSF